MAEMLGDAHQRPQPKKRPQPQAVIFIGIQGVGKSTFYKQLFADTHIRLNLDMLRTRHREAILLAACLAAKQPFVSDNTNPTKSDRQRYILPAKSAQFAIIGYYFHTGPQVALQYNAQREGRARVPDRAIWGTLRRLETPAFDEGFDALYNVKIDEHGSFVVSGWHSDLADDI